MKQILMIAAGVVLANYFMAFVRVLLKTFWRKNVDI